MSTLLLVALVSILIGFWVGFQFCAWHITQKQFDDIQVLKMKRKCTL